MNSLKMFGLFILFCVILCTFLAFIEAVSKPRKTIIPLQGHFNLTLTTNKLIIADSSMTASFDLSSLDNRKQAVKIWNRFMGFDTVIIMRFKFQQE